MFPNCESIQPCPDEFSEQDMKAYFWSLSSVSAVIEPIPMGDAAKDYLSRYVNPTLLTGLTELSKKKPLDPFVSLSFDLKVIQIDLKLIEGKYIMTEL